VVGAEGDSGDCDERSQLKLGGCVRSRSWSAQHDRIGGCNPPSSSIPHATQLPSTPPPPPPPPLVPLILGLQTLLVLHKLVLHEQVVLDALQLEQAELAARGGGDDRQLRAEGGRRVALPLLLADARRGRGGLPLLLLLLGALDRVRWGVALGQAWSWQR